MKKLLLGILFLLSTSFANAQWHQTNGPEGGIVNCMAANGSNIFVAVENEGIYRSTDYGQTWLPANYGLTDPFWATFLNSHLNVNALTISNNHIYAAIWELRGRLFVSSDNGQSWAPVDSGLTVNYISSLIVKNDTIFVGTPDQGIFVSANNGKSWSSANNGLPTNEVRALAFCGNTLIAACPAAGIFISTNDGQSWILSNNGLSSTMIFSLTVSGNNIYAGTFGGGVNLSTDGGQSWTPVNLNTGLNSPGIYCLASKGDSIFAGAYTLYTSAVLSDVNTLHGGIFLSTNGRSWSKVVTGFDYDINSIVSTGTHIYAGTQGGGIIHSGDDGQNWVLDNSGIKNATVNALAYDGDNIYAGTQGGGIFLSTDNGQNWIPMNSGLTNTYVQALAIYDNQIFAGTHGGGVFISKDGGQSWIPSNNGLTNGCVTTLAINGNNIFAGTYNEELNQGGMFLSTDNGQSWSPINTGLTNTAIRTCVVNGNNVIVGTNDFKSGKGGIFLSTNNGQSWSDVSDGLTDSLVLALSFSGDTIFAGTQTGKIFRSINNCKSWTKVGDGFIKASSIHSLFVSNDTIFAGSEALGAILFSTNNGQTWSEIEDTALYHTDGVGALTIYKNNILAGTRNGGVWKCPINNLVRLPAVPTIGIITQPSCSVATGSVVLNGLPTGIGGNWTINPGNITGSTSSTTVTGLSPGTYNFTVNYAGCTSDASADVVINAQSPDTPATPVITLLNDTTLHSDAITGNQWYTQNGLINGAIYQDYVVKTDGDYCAIVTLNGCSSDTSNIIKVVIAGITIYGDQKAITIYPNPFANELIIEIKGNTKKIDFEIVNAVGQIVFKGNIVEKAFVSTSNFAPGIYILKFVNGDKVAFKKVIKAKK